MRKVNREPSTERKTFNTLASKIPNLRKAGLRPTIREALRWIYPDARQDDDGVWNFEDMSRVEEDWVSPGFAPDATRFRKCAFAHAPSEHTPCVELWEIENTHPLSNKKIAIIEDWIYGNWDGAMHPQFELWRADRNGNGIACLLSTAKNSGIELIDLEEAQ